MCDCYSTTAMAPSSPATSIGCADKKHWWLSNKKIVDKYVKEARILMASQEESDIAAALALLDDALSILPRFEAALELKARSLLYLRRFKDVAEMLQDHIPSLKVSEELSLSSSSSLSSQSLPLSAENPTQPLTRERVKLLSSSGGDSPSRDEDGGGVKCFSVSDLKKKVLAGLGKNVDKQGQWRYLVLGQACCHLGLMEDAMALLQTGKRLASAAFRRESVCWSDDSFSFSLTVNHTTTQSPPKTEAENICQILSQIKLLLRRKTAALAALDASLYNEAVRHFSKIVESRRGAPQWFLAECYKNRALAYKSAGRVAEALADCNKTLALDPSCIQALHTRSSLFETIRCLPDALHDLEHLKLLYNTLLRDRKLPGPAWKRQNVHYREIPGKLCSLSTKMQELKKRVAAGETNNVDYYGLMGLRRGCSRSELERAHLLLTLRHKPDKSISFIDRCEFADQNDIESVRDRAKMSSFLLYRLIQKGYTNVMTTVMDEENVEKQRKKAATALAMQVQKVEEQPKLESESLKSVPKEPQTCNRVDKAAAVFQGVFCRDLAVVGNLLSQTGFNRPIPVKYEALSC